MLEQSQALPANEVPYIRRPTQVRNLLEALSRREVLALAASASPSNHFQWASLGPGAGLTENQEDFVDYWSPDLVLEDCRARRELICALDDWALTSGTPDVRGLVSRLLNLMVSAEAAHSRRPVPELPPR